MWNNLCSSCQCSCEVQVGARCRCSLETEGGSSLEAEDQAIHHETYNEDNSTIARRGKSPLQGIMECKGAYQLGLNVLCKVSERGG